MPKIVVPYANDVKIAAGIMTVGAAMVVGAGAYLLAENILASRLNVAISDDNNKWTRTVADGLLDLAGVIVMRWMISLMLKKSLFS